MRKYAALLLLCLLALAGCDRKASYENFIQSIEKESPEEISLARESLALLQARDFEGLARRLDPRLKNAQDQATLARMAAMFPPGRALDVKLIGLHQNFFAASGASTIQLAYQYAFPEKQWLQADITVSTLGNNRAITALNVMPLPDALENTHAFTFWGKGLTHGIVFIAMIGITVFTVYALIICYRTPIPKRKALWFVFILCGVMTLQLNWTDGSLSFKPFNLTFFGAGFMRAGPYSPLVMTISLPLGAILFFHRRKHWLAKAAPRETPKK